MTRPGQAEPKKHCHKGTKAQSKKIEKSASLEERYA